MDCEHRNQGAILKIANGVNFEMYFLPADKQVTIFNGFTMIVHATAFIADGVIVMDGVLRVIEGV